MLYARRVIGPPRIAPSILAADFSRLGDQISAVTSHVDLFHLDVMDGHFVPNISFGVPVIAAIRPLTDVTFDCHLMMTDPQPYLPALREAGADLVTVHIEALPEPGKVAAQARALGLGFGLVINPPTPFEAVAAHLELCDMILVMSVHPGFGGQTFIPEVLAKVEQARKFIDQRALPVDVEIDGGIGPETIRSARDAGADVFVAGSAVFGADDPVAAVAELRKSVEDRPPPHRV